MTPRKPAIRIIPFVDWPLEGFHTFEQNRMLFQRQLVSLLRDRWPDSASMVLGGQTRLVNAFLEVQPDWEADVARAVAAGKFGIGPWYVEPDVFLVSGEALIRNLLAGQADADQLGGRLNVGVLFESAGASGQLPQILNGFGLSAAMIAHGIGLDWSEFWWESPDGSTIALFQPAATFHPHDLQATQADLKRTLRDIRDAAEEWSALDPLLLPAGGFGVALSAEDLQTLLATADKTSGVRIDVASLEQALLEASSPADDWPSVAGELRSPALSPVWSGSASSRMWIKQRNAAAQALLGQWAEPFSAWLDALDGHPDTASADNLRHAWRILLDNHNSAAIRGTVGDRTAQEIATRFDRVEQIGHQISNGAIKQLASRIDTDLLPVDGPYLPIIVFNAGDSTRTDRVIIDLDLPDGYRVFELVDEDGNHVAFEGLVAEDAMPGEGQVRVRFIATEVPPFGFRTYAIRPFQYLDDKGYDDTPGLSIENEWLSVTFDPADGAFNIFDRRSGRSFSGLNRYVDGGDRGDLYTYCPPRRDTLIDIAANTPLQVERLVGPVTQSLHVLEIYRLPERLSKGRETRLPMAAQFVPMSISTTIELSQQVPRVDVTIRVSTSALDHRLRVHFPAGMGEHDVLFASDFEVVSRDTRVPGPDDTTQWAEQPSADFPFHSFVTLMGNETGLTVATRDLSEAGLLFRNNSDAELAMTLLRSVGWLCRDDLPNRVVHPGSPTPASGAQVVGEHEYRYSLLPHGSDLVTAWRDARSSLTPLRAFISEPSDGTLSLSGSLLTADNPAFVITAIKHAEDRSGLIVRGFNLLDDNIEVAITLGLPFAEVRAVRMDETPIKQNPPPTIDEDGRIMCQVAGHQILTLWIDA